MANEFIPQKYRDEDLTERRKRSRRRWFIGGRRKIDNPDKDGRKSGRANVLSN